MYIVQDNGKYFNKRFLAFRITPFFKKIISSFSRKNRVAILYYPPFCYTSYGYLHAWFCV